MTNHDHVPHGGPGPGDWPGAALVFISAIRPPSDRRLTLPDGRPVPAVIGAPLDRTTSYRSGTAEGPAALREASWSIETYSPVLDADLADIPVVDYGNVFLDPAASLEGSLEAIERAVAQVVAEGYLPVMVGGEHLVTLAAYRAAAGDGELPVLLHYDAHADLRDDYDLARLSHATVARRIAELVGGKNVYQFGIRSGDRQEMEWGRRNVNRPPGTLLGATRQALREVAGRRVYLTVDLDVLSPAEAPGTGSPEPGGPGLDELLQAVRAIGAAAHTGSIRLAGADLVELSPRLDPTGRTPVVAAKLLRELFIAYGR